MLLSYKERAVGPVAFLFTLRRGSWCIFGTNQRKAAHTQNLFSSVCTCDHAGGGVRGKVVWLKQPEKFRDCTVPAPQKKWAVNPRVPLGSGYTWKQSHWSSEKSPHKVMVIERALDNWSDSHLNPFCQWRSGVLHELGQNKNETKNSVQTPSC